MANKLSPSLKALINAPSARPGVREAPAGIYELFENILRDANKQKQGIYSWLAIAVSATGMRSAAIEY